MYRRYPLPPPLSQLVCTETSLHTAVLQQSPPHAHRRTCTQTCARPLFHSLLIPHVEKHIRRPTIHCLSQQAVTFLSLTRGCPAVTSPCRERPLTRSDVVRWFKPISKMAVYPKLAKRKRTSRTNKTAMASFSFRNAPFVNV